MESLFQANTHITILKRLESLSPSSTASWGKMNVSQMLNHCQKPLEIPLYNRDFNLKSNFLIKLLFKKSMYDDSKIRKNLPTSKAFKIIEPKDFITEKTQLKKLIEDFYELRSKESFQPHPVFGNFTTSQWGQMQYKHLDHHFTQFGV
ncbi:DUF1569 domain-containing protein [Leeuwenhoekiella sp. MAR_2009_132]|uniref:DUF1569 domain-containing protein n=1 Tax=Leeuwenhoekiella sp. MAR_2009_132 TaxID=1392489 RepID=UPI00048E66A6|nr:DUF1569 domain-containing protein [Leeuwenhoekiella sp. MAR_2009_132]